MDRGPQVRDLPIETVDRSFIGQVDPRMKRQQLVLAPFAGGIATMGHVADGAGCQQRLHDGAAESPDAASDDDGPTLIVHTGTPLRTIAGVQRPSFKPYGDLAASENEGP